MLITDPADLALHTPCERVTGKAAWGEIPGIVKVMRRTLKETKGVGLAACQIGVMLRVVLMYDGTVMVNPRMEVAGGHRGKMREGCLSIPGKEFMVERFTNVKVTYQDEQGHMQFDHCTGIDAQIVQHELDHLDGKLCRDQGTLIK